MNTVQAIRQKTGLNLFNGDGAFGANLNTGLATEALVGIYRISFAVNKLKYLSGASVYTFFITSTLVFVNFDLPHNSASKIIKN